MARHSEKDATAIYNIAQQWRTVCLLEGKSLLWSGEDIWARSNLLAFKKCFIDRPDQSQATFEEKFKRQLEGDGPEVTKLACELLLVYFLFPTSVSGRRKCELINLVASWRDIKIEGTGAAILKELDTGIGGCGLAYNTRRPFELAYLAEVALALASKSETERDAILNDHLRLRTMLDETQGDTAMQGRDILLHLLFPERYERIASRGHKQLIARSFTEVLDESSDAEDLDDRLFAIRSMLETLLPDVKKLDFYWPPLAECWYVRGPTETLDPIEALRIKRQIVLFGPPGTGKTHEARELAQGFVRQGLLRSWKPKRYFKDAATANLIVSQRVQRIQFHPGYSYEDLVRGLQLLEGGTTGYRDGVLLQIIGALGEEVTTRNPMTDIPFVLILDEMNRADLSKALGECFSALEDRDLSVRLAGQDNRDVKVPSNLYFIGTMNLIDQSLEQVDFALRRRFLWFLRDFSREEFLEIARQRWNKLREEKLIPVDWERFEGEFEILAERAEAINADIGDHPSLGGQYQIGHTYFCDVVSFVRKDLSESPRRQRVLFSAKGQAREPVTTLWTYSLKPLIEQYLSGVEPAEREEFVRHIGDLLAKGSSSG